MGGREWAQGVGGYGAIITPWGKIVPPELVTTCLSPKVGTGWFPVLLCPFF